MDSINYAAFDLKKRQQFGSDERVAANQKIEDFDYTDGLSQKELTRIDKNKDGAISEEEFKTSFGGDSANTYKSYWDSYKSFYNATSKKISTGTQTTTTKEDGTVVISNYDKNGNLDVFMEEKTNDLGGIDKVVYDFKNGEKVATSKTTFNPNGTSYTENLKTGSVSIKNVDGTYCWFDKDGNLTRIQTEAYGEKEAYSFKYAEDGKLTSAKVNGKNYTNITQKDNEITIKDKDGKVVAKLTSDGSSNTYFTEYANGKKSKRVAMDSDGMPEYVVKYDKDGKSKSKFLCEYNQLREYQRDASGKLVKSVDTRDGKLYSEQTYSNQTQKDVYGDTRPASQMWATRTFYDENGNVKSYVEYEYQKKDEDGNVVRTVDYYGADKKTQQKTVVTTLDEYTNKISAITYDDKEIEKSRTAYEYDVELDREVPDTHIVSKTIEEGAETTVENYNQGVLTDTTVVTMNNGIASSESYRYKYHTNGEIKEEEHTKVDGSVEATEYDDQGNKTSEKISLTSFLLAQYPDLTNAQISQLAKRCARINDLKDTNSLINFTDGKFDIKIPEFEVVGDTKLDFK